MKKKRRKNFLINPINYGLLQTFIKKKDIQINIKSQLGTYYAVGTIHKTALPDSFYFISPSKTTFSSGVFDIYQIESISENPPTITLKSHFNSDEIYQKTYNPNFLLNKRITVFINYPFWEESKIKKFVIEGILNYNKKEEVFYIKNIKLTNLVSFKQEAINGTHYPENDLPQLYVEI